MKKLENFFRIRRDDPASDWDISLISFAALLILAILANIFFYSRLSWGESETSATIAPSEILNREELEKTIKDLKAKEIDSSILPASVLEDPSI